MQRIFSAACLLFAFSQGIKIVEEEEALNMSALNEDAHTDKEENYELMLTEDEEGCEDGADCDVSKDGDEESLWDTRVS